MNTPFLSQVARHYASVEGLEDYCFVFPNRRSGQFFAHYLQQQLVSGSTKPHLLPRVASINELVAELTGTVAATDIEMMFSLYEAYCQAMGDAAQEFDKFIYWAQLIIGDFNDIDKSLADAASIYQNLSDQHDLTSNYLDPEVKDQVQRLFGDSLFTAFFDTSVDADMWQNFKKNKNDDERQDEKQPRDEVVKKEFMNLWNALSTIYDNYHAELTRQGIVSSGMQLRQAAEGELKPLRYSRLVLVGFGVLSAAEVKLFDHFKKEEIADFWWDNVGVRGLLSKAPYDPGALLIDGYCERFGAMSLEKVENKDQSLRVVGVPSGIGQAKQAFDEVMQMRKDEDGAPGIDTAIVLPDENLLVPLLHSVHGVDLLNVTLGYPLRSSGIVSLMHIVARMHSQAAMEGKVWTYYREDVYDILSHPLIKTHFTSEVLEKTAQLMCTNRFRIPASELETLSFGGLFQPAMDTRETGDERQRRADYLDQLIAFCNLLMGRMLASRNNDADEDENDTAKRGVELPLQQAFLVMYIDVLNQLKQALADCERPLQRSTIFYMIDRLTSSVTVPFTGEPLQGLQIMGLLETRNLDFKNVVILSMNERVFPRRRSINSFIPNYIRRAHGMSTIEQQEAIVAFNFYRLLNRASHVTLVYDSSTQVNSSNEPSRYITQLDKVYGKTIEYVELNPVIQTSSPIQIQVANTGYSLREVYNRDPETEGGKYLSASAIKKYIDCPLMFYMHYVQHLNTDNDAGDFMDSGTFGTIVHDTLKDCYDSQALRDRNGLVDEDYIEWFRKNHLDESVKNNIKRLYLRVPEDKMATAQVRGEAFMLIDTIKTYVNYVLDYDKKLICDPKDGIKKPFTILGCEETIDLPKMKIGNSSFNFTFKIDRVDRLADGTVRIVDYKTGSDKTKFKTVNNLFDSNDKDYSGAILQLFLYCYAYQEKHGTDVPVMPVIYKVPSMDDSGVIYENEQFVFTRDNEIVKEFILRMGGLANAIYDNDFCQALDDASACNYCRFIDFCRRTPKKTW